jgi:hypothetical protein
LKCSFLKTGHRHKAEDVAELFKAVLHIALVTRPCPQAHVHWVRCASGILSTFKRQLYGALVLDLDVFWDYFEGVIAENSTAHIDANARAPTLGAAAQLCKVVRPRAAAWRVHALCPNAASTPPARMYCGCKPQKCSMPRQTTSKRSSQPGASTCNRTTQCSISQPAHSLCRVVQAKAFFPAQAAATVWSRLSPQLAQPLTPQCLEAVTWLLLFFPHRAIAQGEAGGQPWGEWAARALDLWRLQAHNTFWEGAWTCLFSRLAKHDVHVRWPTFPYAD